jgi:hypothetical protein
VSAKPEHSLRIGIFVMTFPQASETFIVTKVLKLLDAGFDVHIFSVNESPHWSAFEVLAGRDDVRARVHLLAPTSPRSRALRQGVAELDGAAGRPPR